MKKNYNAPEMTVCMLEIESNILSSSTGMHYGNIYDSFESSEQYTKQHECNKSIWDDESK